MRERGTLIPSAPFRELGSEIGSGQEARLTIFTNILNVGKGTGAFFVQSATAQLLRCTQNGKDEMPPFTDVTYVYDPEALKIMGAAFDVVCQTFPPDMRDHEGARRRLALIILRHMDQGERDATRLSELAMLDFTRPHAVGGATVRGQADS